MSSPELIRLPLCSFVAHPVMLVVENKVLHVFQYWIAQEQNYLSHFWQHFHNRRVDSMGFENQFSRFEKRVLFPQNANHPIIAIIHEALSKRVWATWRDLREPAVIELKVKLWVHLKRSPQAKPSFLQASYSANFKQRSASYYQVIRR